MTGRHLLDTNVVIGLFNGESRVETRLTALPEVFLSAVVLGELYFGAMNSGRPEANAARVSDFAASCTVLGIDAETARQYGLLKGALRKKGRPIPENDLWIAACALVHDLILTTYDRHFEHVEGLRLESW